MKGFEIRLNDEEPLIAASDNLAFVIVGAGPDDNYIYVGGADMRFYSMVWWNKKLQKGDKVRIKLTDAGHISPAQSVTLPDKEELKKRYERLKAELSEKGLI